MLQLPSDTCIHFVLTCLLGSLESTRERPAESAHVSSTILGRIRVTSLISQQYLRKATFYEHIIQSTCAGYQRQCYAMMLYHWGAHPDRSLGLYMGIGRSIITIGARVVIMAATSCSRGPFVIPKNPASAYLGWPGESQCECDQLIVRVLTE